MAIFILLVSFLSFNILFTTPVSATYPTPDIAHWDLSISDERNDADYKEVQSLVEQKYLDAALALLNKKIEELPKEASPIILKAFVLHEKGLAKESLENLLIAFKMERQHPALHFAFCQIHRKLGNAKISDRACIIAAQQHHRNPLAHYEYAQTLMAMGNSMEALKELTHAENLDKTNSSYPYKKGMIFIYQNKIDEAEKSFKKALFVNEKNIEAAYQLAYLYATQDKVELSKTYVNKVLDMGLQHPKVESAKLLRDYIFKNQIRKLPKKLPRRNII